MTCIHWGENRPVKDMEILMRILSGFLYSLKIGKCFLRSKKNVYICISPQQGSLKKLQRRIYRKYWLDLPGLQKNIPVMTQSL